MPEVEWNFDWLNDSRITSAECFACWEWEFNRELAKLPKVAVRLAEIRTGWAKTESGLYEQPVRLRGQFWCEFEGLVFCQSWPEKPYQEASTLEKEAIQHAARGNIPFQPLDIQVCLQTLQLASRDETLRKHFGEPSGTFGSGVLERKNCEGKAYTTIAAFELDWRRRDSEIFEDFKRWVAKARESNTKAETILSGKGAGSLVRQYKAELKALGAFRLRQKMSYRLAVALVSRVRNSGEMDELYSTESHWSEADKRARERIEFFKELKFPQGDVRPFPKMEIPW